VVRSPLYNQEVRFSPTVKCMKGPQVLTSLLNQIRNYYFYSSVYPDVADTLKQWSEGGRKVYIYSSGSVEAQKLLFGNSEAGDLLGFINGHFDTAVGPKTNAESYTAIAKEIGLEPNEILFLTDVVKGLHSFLS